MAAFVLQVADSIRLMPAQVICPRCRYVLDEASDGALHRCPKHHDTVLVATSALSEADGDPFLGMIVNDRFAILAVLGSGSTSTVYRARQRPTDRDVALKIVRKTRLSHLGSRDRFEQEARATSLLRSQHTVTVFDFGQVVVGGSDPHKLGGSLFLVMELLDGESLGDRLKRVKRLDAEEAVRFVGHALISLAEAHQKGVIHRDLKPDNLILTETPAKDAVICKVIDFGIALWGAPLSEMDALETQVGTVFGTPRYMSPEQAQGKVIDARSDLYSLGVILYQCITGQPPFMASDAAVVMAHHINTEPKRPSEAVSALHVPAALEDLMMRVLDKRPHKRPQTAEAFMAELDALGIGETGAKMAVAQKRPP